MKAKTNFKDILQLFLTFFKTGLLTFGGGYAMIPILQKEVSEKRKWIDEREIIDILAISESTPGPIAVNTATYVGYEVAGFWGSFFATLGLVLPSFVIIFVISFFYKDFMKWQVMQAAFKGLRIGVIILLIKAVLKLKKAIKFSLLSWIIFAIAFIGLFLTTFFEVRLGIGSFNISISLLFILFGIITGIVATKIKGGNEQ